MQNSWMAELGRDRWEISKNGQKAYEDLKQRCAEGIVNVRHGYLWTSKFKKILMPTYEPHETDAQRPKGSIYDDTQYAVFLDEYV